MAKKRGRPAKSKTATTISNAERKQINNGKKQMMSIIVFAVAIFLFFVVIFKGQSVWLVLHNFFLGVFGICAYVWPLLLATVAVLYAMERLFGSLFAKVIEVCVLIILIGSAIDIFTVGDKLAIGEHLSNAYSAGYRGGGFLGALIGGPLSAWFGKTGAAITVFLLIFVFLMLITGTTLITFLKALSKPVKKIEKHAEDAFNSRLERQNNKDEKEDVSSLEQTSKKRFEWDFDVDEIPEKRERKVQDLSEGGKKVIDSYYGNESATQTSYKPKKQKNVELSSDGVDTALNAAKEENDTINIVDTKQNEEITSKSNSAITISDNESYSFPPISLLKEPAYEQSGSMSADLDATATHLVETLRSFGVETKIVDISRGPTVTRYELQPCAGVKISKITNLADDIALNLATAGVRIEAPIPNKAAVGIEVPNKANRIVTAREIIESPTFMSAKSPLTVALGRDIGGNIIVTDISKLPHGLIAGATGSGKSVCINSIIMSILYKASPDDVKLLMIDPKVVELGIYNGIPHLLVPVVTDPRKASGALGWAVTEMEKRYKMFAENDVRNLDGYNKLAESNPEMSKMPRIVIIIDELADLMMTASNEVEDAICRIAQKARAAGMHLIVATQRPSVDVVTGLIKANIPSRIAFAVSSQMDSRTILDGSGAEKLLGRGDMLFSPVGSTKPNRIQGCFVSDAEVEDVVEYVKANHAVEYDDNVKVEIERQAAIEKKQKTGLPEDGPDEDPMLTQAIQVVVEAGQASTSLLQRKLKLGYARAARIIDEMEERGVVGPYEGSKPRKVLISATQLALGDETESTSYTDSDDEE